MPDPVPTVFIVDDDADLRESLEFLVRSAGRTTRTFPSAVAFLAEYHPDQPGCVVTDVRMPGLSGLDLIDRLAAAGWRVPVICMTAYSDVPMAVRALKSGACEFLEKPFTAAQMLQAIDAALAADRRQRAAAAGWKAVEERLASLTDREREALDLILEGAPNKVMAIRLGITERAVELRRASILRKLRAGSLAELVQIVTHYRLLSATSLRAGNHVAD